jgi:hypothetical protein
MIAIGRRRPQRADSAQPRVGAFGIATLAHRLDHLPCLRRGIVAALRDQEVGGAVDIVIGDGHQERVASMGYHIPIPHTDGQGLNLMRQAGTRHRADLGWREQGLAAYHDRREI